MQDKKSVLLNLSAAALLLNTLSETVRADPPNQDNEIDFRYSHYHEGEIPAGNTNTGKSSSRYDIDVFQAKGKIPVTEDTELTISGIAETMSGASPWYVVPDEKGDPVQVMSGATIDETRMEVGADFRSYNLRSESTLSASYSTENDYSSLSFGFSGIWRLNNNLTTLNYGMSAGKDNIDASDTDKYPTRPSGKDKSRVSGFVGFSQVIDKNRLVGANIGMTSLQGFLSDPYKWATVNGMQVQDSRPESQSQFSGSLLFRQFFNDYDAALHTDLSFYYNDWEVFSQTADVGWYQNFGNNWQIVPSMRLYHQSAAAFYEPYYKSTRQDGYYSSDYRLSEFTALSGRIKLEKQWSQFYGNVSYEHYGAFGDHPALVSFDVVSVGIGMNF
ncbi:DUF3570 domain-containing protein [Gynuella sunshinyii]|uniref:DUF3570 domain-containing protein n=1 Tax=Gynuella sunshinyii YC6258 TaxID=1445510 RepID=A0A0C5VV74_9GAMM|nr:DUF3570 domain-containing protein [Gynuella sunshinyii]AJQ94304.1 hypothetical Protein YC6258_02266 [Gynuella sunshinyii YC6258]